MTVFIILPHFQVMLQCDSAGCSNKVSTETTAIVRCERGTSTTASLAGARRHHILAKVGD